MSIISKNLSTTVGDLIEVCEGACNDPAEAMTVLLIACMEIAVVTKPASPTEAIDAMIGALNAMKQAGNAFAPHLMKDRQIKFRK